MMSWEKIRRAMFTSAMLVIGVTLATAVHARPDRPGDRDGRHHPVVKDRECVGGCQQELRECRETARDEASECFATCSDTHERAREICGDDPTGDACQAAKEALRECLMPCHARLRPALRACIGNGRECVHMCPDVLDRTCVQECRADHATCRSTARAEAQICREGCAAEHDAAVAACADDTPGDPSDECVATREALKECVAPCREAFRAALGSCRDDLQECVRGCELDEPEPSGDEG
jgi:hypothetical protein